MVASAIVDGASTFSWAMRGDSANNVLFARDVIDREGVAVGPDENPVPFPSALMAIIMASGRGSVASGDLIQHDIGAFTQLWGLCIVLMCLLVGAAAASIARTTITRSGVVGMIAAIASVIPLSWFFTGCALEFAFFSSQVAVPTVLAAFLGYLGSARRPAAALLRRADNAVALGAAAIMVASALGLGILIFTSRREPSLWTYYPTKFAWLASAIAIVLIAGLIPAAVARYARSLTAQVTSVAVLLAATGVFVAKAPDFDEGFPRKLPVDWFLDGRVVVGGFPDREPGTPRVRLQHRHAITEPKDLCTIMALMGGGVTVITANDDLKAELQTACASTNPRVIVTQGQPSDNLPSRLQQRRIDGNP